MKAIWIVLTVLLCMENLTAEVVCPSPEEFVDNGWESKMVQKDMDRYLRDHRMRVNWMQEPRPPNAVGKDYYEWLWIDEFGAAMKAELVEKYCGATVPE